MGPRKGGFRRKGKFLVRVQTRWRLLSCYIGMCLAAGKGLANGDSRRERERERESRCQGVGVSKVARGANNRGSTNKPEPDPGGSRGPRSSDCLKIKSASK